MQFDMADFQQRVKSAMEARGISAATLSKRLFNKNARTLPGLLAGEVSPRWDSLVEAERVLTKLEQGEANAPAS